MNAPSLISVRLVHFDKSIFINSLALKASALIVLTDVGIVIVVKPVPEKQPIGMLVIPSGKFTDIRFLAPLKHPSPIIILALGIVTDVNPLFKNAPSPKDVILSVITILVNALHLLNAFFSIINKFSGRFIELRDVHPSKAAS